MDKDAPLIHIEQRRNKSSIICRKVDESVDITIVVDGISATISLNQLALKHLVAGLSKGVDDGRTQGSGRT
jgi:hypothetical protein